MGFGSDVEDNGFRRRKRQRNQGHNRWNADIANSSRFIKTEEVKAAVGKGVYPVPFAIAMDAVIPVVHPDNPVQNLTIDQLQKIYSGVVTNWMDVGGENKPIAVVGRDTSSGTYETWEKIVMKKERVTPRALVVASSGAMITTVAKTETPSATTYRIREQYGEGPIGRRNRGQR